MVLFYEQLSLLDVFLLPIKASFWKKETGKKLKSIYWIDASLVAKGIVKLIGGLIDIPIERLNFKLSEIRDQNGVSIRNRLSQNDLFTFWSLINRNRSLSSQYFGRGSKSRVLLFLQKTLLKDSIVNRDSTPRVLYIMNVTSQNEAINKDDDRILILQERLWKEEYAIFARALGLRLKWSKKRRTSLKFITFVIGTLYKIPKLYNLLQKQRGVGVNKFPLSHSGYIFMQGRGDDRLINDGNNSDLDCIMQSDLPHNRVIYLCHNSIIPKEILKSEIKTVRWKDTQANILSTKGHNIHFKEDAMSTMSRKEKREIKKVIRDYHLQNDIWSGFFKKYIIKVFMTWYKYDGLHAVMADAIKEQGGISAVNQIAFDGYRNFECKINCDLVFGFSKFSAEIEKDLNSEIPYFLITGYPRDHAKPLLEARAREIRRDLQQAGAKKIIFAIDENSIDDDRWHAGHAFQQENYRYVLEKVLEYPWLGAIFKPKAPYTLRHRLGEVNKLLEAAEQTARCIVLESKHYRTTVEPVLLAGLAADVCIHGHLSAGTAALECALAGLPTLLVDREHVPFSKLHQLPKDKVVFENWPSTIEAVMEQFKSEKSIPGFGVWGDFLEELDSFRDGKASYRIGTYLKWLLEGYDQGLSRDAILSNAATRYAEQWGTDKVMSINGPSM